VVFEGGKINQISIQRESGHLIFDGFLRIRCRFSNRSPDLLQDFLNFWSKARNIFVDIFRCCLG
jgi:hypothetical protein